MRKGLAVGGMLEFSCTDTHLETHGQLSTQVWLERDRVGSPTIPQDLLGDEWGTNLQCFNSYCWDSNPWEGGGT